MRLKLKMKKSKLYENTKKDFKLPLFVDRSHHVHTRPANHIPMIIWPDGRWCLLANMYMLYLYQKGLSRKNGGGTLKTYAANLSHLIRYCFYNQIDFIDLTDNQFTLFIKTLQGEHKTFKGGPLARDSNSVIAIGRNCIDFLNYVGEIYGDEDFIGFKGRIVTQKKKYRVPDTNKKRISPIIQKYWHHRSFPTPDPKNNRLPISTVNIEGLKKAVHTLSNTIFQRKRRYAMIKLLEITAGRRSEISLMNVKDVYDANEMIHPEIRITTMKQGGNETEYRKIPISRHNLKYLIEYIEKNRRRIIRTTCGLSNDDGSLLINERTGYGLKANTITQEIRLLCNEAGIKERASPHMFRHRFITSWFVELIEQHCFENEDDFRRSMIDVETIKKKLQEWTGHKNIGSLDRYIHLAFEEASNFKKAYNAVSLSRSIKSFLETLEQKVDDLRSNSSGESVQQIEEFIESMKEDLERYQN